MIKQKTMRFRKYIQTRLFNQILRFHEVVGFTQASALSLRLRHQNMCQCLGQNNWRYHFNYSLQEVIRNLKY